MTQQRIDELIARGFRRTNAEDFEGRPLMGGTVGEMMRQFGWIRGNSIYTEAYIETADLDDVIRKNQWQEGQEAVN